MFELSVAIILTVLICSIAFSWNENAKRQFLRQEKKKQNQAEMAEYDARQQELERLSLKSIEDIRILRTQLADLKTDISSMKVSLGWSQDK